MKQIILNSLTLTNWRGERSRTTEFHPTTTTIAGGNGLGKSRHFDAFTWLLFGKDTKDRKDFNIKTIINGEPLTKTDCEVKGVLNVGGETITLRRVFVEEWVKPRGQVEQVFKGNKTECYWNDTPVSVTEYQKRIKAIIDDTVFKVLTNPEYFASMPWKQQREQLDLIAGTVSDEEMASQKPEFAAFLDNIKGKGIEDFKRELSARKKRLKADLAEVQPRIDQTRKLMPEASDFEALAAELARIDTEITHIDKAIADMAERSNQQHREKQALQDQLNTLKRQRQQVIFDAETKAREEQHKANAERRALEERVNEAKRARAACDNTQSATSAKSLRLKATIQELNDKLQALRDKWYAINEEAYSGSTVCSCCGQALPEAMKAEALEHFNKHKQERLQELSTKGKALKEEQQEAEHNLKAVEEEQERINDERSVATQTLEALEQQLTQCPEAEAAKVVAEELPEYTVLTQQINDLEAQQATLQDTVHTDSSEAYQTHKKELTTLRDAIRTKLSDRERIAAFEKQITELENQGRTIAQQIADIEHEEYTAYEFSRIKAETCEQRINNMFSLVTFKLFEYTIEDTNKEHPTETCIPLVNGVPFSTANTAAQVNAGIDIINTLCRFYDTTAPIFIDGRERVNELIDTESQIINLVVTEDKELVIK